MSHGGSGAIISLFIFFCNSALTGSIFLETLSKKSIMRNAMSPMLIQPLKVCCDCLLCELTFLASFDPGSQCKYNRAWERRIKLSDWIGPQTKSVTWSVTTSSVSASCRPYLTHNNNKSNNNINVINNDKEKKRSSFESTEIQIPVLESDRNWQKSIVHLK